MRRLRTLIALALALSLVGCGGGDGGGDNDGAEGRKKQSAAAPETSWIEGETASEIVDQAAQAMRGLADVTYEGTADARFPTGVERVRITGIATADQTCQVTVTSKATGTMTVRGLGEVSYVRADSKALTVAYGLSASEASLFTGRWVSGPSSEITGECDIEDLSSTRVDPTTCTKGRKSNVDATPSIAVKCRTSEGSTTLYVSTIGAPLVLEVDGVSEDGPFHARMVDHNSGVTIKKPPKKQVIDGTQLQ